MPKRSRLPASRRQRGLMMRGWVAMLEWDLARLMRPCPLYTGSRRTRRNRVPFPGYPSLSGGFSLIDKHVWRARHVRKCNLKPVYSPSRPLVRKMSRTASTVFGALSRRTPLLAAIEYSSCRLTWSHGQNRESTQTKAAVLTLTSSNAVKDVREWSHA